MQMVTYTTLTLQLVIVYGIIRVMNTTKKWLSERNESMQVECASFSGVNLFHMCCKAPHFQADVERGT